MSTIVVENIGVLMTGDINNPTSSTRTLFIKDGILVAEEQIGQNIDWIVNAGEMLVIPGIIDGHVHPTVGEFTPVQDSTGWIGRYLHCGITSMISAGELHYPGMFDGAMEATLLKAIAVANCYLYKRRMSCGTKMFGGTLLLARGMIEKDFDEIRALGSKCVKFIFYPYGEEPGEDEQYVAWAKAKGLVVKLHSGGVSRSGVSKRAGSEIVRRLNPDIVAHLNGGPIPMSWAEVEEVIDSTGSYIEVCYGGNFAFAKRIVERLKERGELWRLVLGTDSPSGTGVVPRGMLRLIAFVSAFANIPPDIAVCAATGNVAKAHRIEGGYLRLGQPADLVVMGMIEGSPCTDSVDVFACGDIPGVSLVIAGGNIVVSGRSEQTPPPASSATVRRP